MYYKTILPTIIISLVIICVICKMNLNLMLFKRELGNKSNKQMNPSYIQINSLNLKNSLNTDTDTDTDNTNNTKKNKNPIVRPIKVKPRKYY